MLRRLVCVVGLCLLGASPAFAWGGDGHRLIMERAIAQLPAEIRPFFEKYKASILEHASDPDLWAGVGFGEEETRHFVDMDAYGEYPFSALPRDIGQANRQFGPDTVVKRGTLAWRAEDIASRLLRAMSSPRGPSLEQVRYLSTILGHYVADAFVPFHAATNYDGQLTGQNGIHSRFESELVRRFAGELRLTSGPLTNVASVRDQVFDVLTSSFQKVAPVLAADREAAAGRELYDDGYFKALFEKTRPILEQQVSAAATAVASAITSLWQQAGKPALPLDPPPRAPRPIVRK